ncbi:sigma-54-dependent Fis family transcriptional regulator [Phyllobacterium salinisoli]|uniref:DNA-binding transcriptional regulator NtrC n=1 Tax=Phyllobacterium salinisoli TaxID=1899321 RepID=A0A368K3V9_9HYPH|nr:sigma-54 dependent transcriptional regulator [Phyllobacterium salinisoli]RCS23931.1 sigma-54-dependent Fis family transcriptional regulator [Phyllobacterium salinisoli]
MTGPILIVDDDPVQRRLLEAAVLRMGHRTVLADGGHAALALLRSRKEISLVILDLVMPDMDGFTVLKRMRETGSSLPVIVQTAQGGLDTVITAMRLGAFDFAVKPVSPERLQVSVANALKLGALEGEIKRIRHSAEGRLTFGDLVTRSEAMVRVIKLGQKAAASNIPILIEGESGVGKEMLARAIQGSGERRGKPFITVNCGAIPDNLAESILFGHEKGSFTGATEKHLGKFVEADGGTLFLDEVGDLSPEIQVKLLRAVQEGEVDAVGGKKPVNVDIRLISATNRNLLDLVKSGQFREDLFYRLHVFPISLPPLRKRREDIPVLVRHFLARFAAEEGRSQIKGITPSALALLGVYDWPGNIRQLENAVFRAVVLCEGTELTVDDFPQIQAQAKDGTADRGDGTRGPNATPGKDDAVLQPNLSGPDRQMMSDRFGQLQGIDGQGQVRSLAQIEEAMVRLAISHYGGQMSEVARRLGIGRSTLYRKLKDYGIDAAGYPGGGTETGAGDDETG